MADNNHNRKDRYNQSNRWQDNERNRPDDYKNENNDQGFSDLDGDGFIGNTGGFYGGTSYLGSNYDDWNNNMERSKMHRDDYGNEFDRTRRSKWQDEKGSQEYRQNRNEFRNQQQNSNYGQSQSQQQGQRHNPYRDQQVNQNRYSGNQQHEGPFYGSNGNYSRQNSWQDQRINRNFNTEHGDNRHQHNSHSDSGQWSQKREGKNWWDKAKDEVSSWFGDDDNDRQRRESNFSGPHRGKGPKGYVRSADRIREDINDRLSDDPYIDASEVDVEINGNEVILKGHVSSREAKRRAEDIVESISGVRHVENRLRVERNDNSSSGYGSFQNTNRNSDNESDNNRKL
jgi:osmotically-inducible protein OsmY